LKVDAGVDEKARNYCKDGEDFFESLNPTLGVLFGLPCIGDVSVDQVEVESSVLASPQMVYELDLANDYRPGQLKKNTSTMMEG
jgi:hypothetical protein